MTVDELRKLLITSKPGDVLKLSGDVPGVRVKDLKFNPSLTIDLTDANVSGLWYWGNIEGVKFLGGKSFGIRIDNAKNITFQDMDFEGDGGYGVHILIGSGIQVQDCVFKRFRAGVNLYRVDGFKIIGNRFKGMTSDGMTLGAVWNGEISWNDFSETAVLSALTHPDGIQLFSRPEFPPTANIVIKKNRIRGLESQGIGMFNHVRDGVDDGGYDNIVIDDNEITVGYPQGIGLMSIRGLKFRRNIVQTYPGAKYKASINIVNCTDVERIS